MTSRPVMPLPLPCQMRLERVAGMARPELRSGGPLASFRWSLPRLRRRPNEPGSRCPTTAMEWSFHSSARDARCSSNIPPTSPPSTSRPPRRSLPDLLLLPDRAGR